MSNPFLIVITVILSLAIIIASIYILVYFQHPEDKNTAWFPKIVVIVGLSLACFSVLMLPLDVSNTETNAGFPMTTLWLVIYILMAAMAVVIVPFAMFYYEGDEFDETGEAPSQLVYAIKGTLIAFIVFAVITAVLYITIGIAQIPVVQLQGTLMTTQNRTAPVNFTQIVIENANFSGVINETDVQNELDYLNSTGQLNVTSGMELPYLCQNITANVTSLQNVTLTNGTVVQQNVTGPGNVSTLLCYYYTDEVLPWNNQSLVPFDKDLPYYISRTNTQVQFRVTIVLFIITIVVFFGWFLFIIFGGIGMVAFPMDCINSWRRRPVRIPLDKYTQRKKEIGDQATRLIEKGKQIQERQKKGRERKRDRKNYNKFRQAVFMLEEDYERLQECYKRQGGKIILYFLTLILGVISVGITIIWLLHIILYVFTQPYPITPFLNTMFIQLDSAWGLLGTIFYGIFSFYLLICVIKGNFKFGMRMFFLFPIHPMRVNGTLMNAFLFNVALIIITSFSINQFCTTAFSGYTSATAINSMFALAVKDMMGIKYIFIGYVYAFFIMVFLTGIFFALRPADRPANLDIY